MLYVCGLPFIIVVVFNVRKLYYLYNQTASVRRTRIANSMSVMFWIIIVIYLLSTIYPLFYIIDYAVLKNRSLLNRRLYFVHAMFSFSLLVNSCLNPLIYFMFSPPILRLLSRLRKCCNHGTDPRISNPRSCSQVEQHSKAFCPLQFDVISFYCDFRNQIKSFLFYIKTGDILRLLNFVSADFKAGKVCSFLSAKCVMNDI